MKEKLIEEEVDWILPTKSRRNEKPIEPVKASKLEHVCEKCKKHFQEKTTWNDTEGKFVRCSYMYTNK